MTSSQSHPMTSRPPRHRVVVTLLALISKRLFALSLADPDTDGVIVGHWYKLRSVMERIDQRQSLDIPAHDRAAMEAAFAQLAHGGQTVQALMDDTRRLIAVDQAQATLEGRVIA